MTLFLVKIWCSIHVFMYSFMYVFIFTFAHLYQHMYYIADPLVSVYTIGI